MLQNHAGSVADIAFRVGFGSPTYFIKCFHDYYGFPPGEVRKIVNAESLNNLTDGQYGESGTYKDLKPKPDIKSLSQRIRNKNLLITSFGILSRLLIIYLLYVLVIKDSGIRIVAKYPEKSIVVLPFKNLSDDSENLYFADGIMEDILNHLFRIKELRVISRTTAESFRGNPITSPEIARKLKVNYVLEGSVYRSENKIKLFVQLIDARNDQHILSEKYEDYMTNIFELQSDIAIKIANVLETVLTNEEIGKIERKPTHSFEAYDYYMKARFLVNKANAEQRVDISKAKDFSNKALAIDPDCAVAHAVQGAYHIYPERRFKEARRELEASLQLDPNSSVAHQWYAQLLMFTGSIEEASLKYIHGP